MSRSIPVFFILSKRKRTTYTDPANILQQKRTMFDQIISLQRWLCKWIDGCQTCERNIRKNSIFLRVLRYNSHICYVSKFNVHSKFHHCPSCDHFNKRAGILERHLTTCKESVKVVFTKIVCQLQEAWFNKLDSFRILYSNGQKLKSLEIFDYESGCVPKEKNRWNEHYNFGRQACSKICISFIEHDWRTNLSAQFQPRKCGWRIFRWVS